MLIKEIKDKDKKYDIAKAILDDLPEWFGIAEAKEEYAFESKSMPFFAAIQNEKEVGFLSIKSNNIYTAEIYVMGIKKDYHRKGIGRDLFKACYGWCKEQGFEFLQVKTLDESHPDMNYRMTREYYLSMGFRPLECFPSLWGEANPCLILIMAIK